jgi:hypothetical protein
MWGVEGQPCPTTGQTAENSRILDQPCGFHLLVTSEVRELFLKEMLDPRRGLFLSKDGGRTLHPNSHSGGWSQTTLCTSRCSAASPGKCSNTARQSASGCIVGCCAQLQSYLFWPRRGLPPLLTLPGAAVGSSWSGSDTTQPCSSGLRRMGAKGFLMTP